MMKCTNVKEQNGTETIAATMVAVGVERCIAIPTQTKLKTERIAAIAPQRQQAPRSDCHKIS
jgi:hypothetical protein